MNHAKRDDCIGQHDQSVIIPRFLFIPDQQLAKAVMPCMRDLDDPASRLLGAIRSLFRIMFLGARAHMWLVTAIPYLTVRVGANVSGIGTQMLR